MIPLQQILRGSRTLQRNLAPRRCVLSSTPRTTFAPSPITRMQASTILTVCHLEGPAPSWSESQRYYTLGGKESFYDLRILDHFTLLFLKDGRNTRVTWTFQFPQYPKKLLDQVFLHDCCYFNRDRGYVADQSARAVRGYVGPLRTFNSWIPYLLEPSSHYVRYGFHRTVGSPQVEQVEQAAVEAISPLPKKWFPDKISSASELAELVDRERQLMKRDLAGEESIVSEITRKQAELRLGNKQLEQVTSRVRSGASIPWSDDEIHTLLDLAIDNRRFVDLYDALSLNLTPDDIREAKRKMTRPTLAKLRAAKLAEAKLRFVMGDQVLAYPLYGGESFRLYDEQYGIATDSLQELVEHMTDLEQMRIEDEKAQWDRD